jgi:hypothetical protein
MAKPGLTSRGNIAPCRFIKIAGGPFGAQQCVADEVAFGVSREFALDTPYVGAPASLAGRDGTPLQYLEQGEVGEIEVGAACADGIRVKPNADGRAVPALANERASGIMLMGQATVGSRGIIYVDRS